MNVTVDEMLAISGPMLDQASEAYSIILKYEDLKPPYKRLEMAHNRLSAAAQPLKGERMREIMAAQAKIDLRHDAIIRGTWGFFTAMAELVGGDEEAAILKLRDLLLPDGLSGQNKTYGGEAGQADQLALRLTPQVRARLNAFVVGEGGQAKPLTVYIDEWISLGRQLGAYEGERGLIEHSPSDGAELHQSRLDWVRAQNAMRSNAEMAGLTPIEMAIVFGALTTAERKADDRAREARARAIADKKQPAEPSNTAPADGSDGPTAANG